jgi:hypothetical protein
LGDSVGWYEDGMLVVETVNINPKQMAESSVPITAEGRIIERFERYSDTEIVYQFTGRRRQPVCAALGPQS